MGLHFTTSCKWTATPLEKHDHPVHYGGKDNPYETVKVIEAWFADAQIHPIVGMFLFNTIKYLSRAGKKNGETLLEDLKKARWYLDRAITWLERKAG
jgi:hypothetical protein